MDTCYIWEIKKLNLFHKDITHLQWLLYIISNIVQIRSTRYQYNKL
jgi:hypothetical protein